MKYTGNYNLKKPEGNDVVNIDDLNDNADIIDQKLKEIEDSVENIEVPVNSVNGKTGDVELTAEDVGAETPAGAQQKANQAEQNAKAYTDQKVGTMSSELAAHLADGIHQKVEVTNTDDATSVTNAPLKSAGGLAVAKKSYFGDVAEIPLGLNLGYYNYYNHKFKLRVGWRKYIDYAWDWSTIFSIVDDNKEWLPCVLDLIGTGGTPAFICSYEKFLIYPNKTILPILSSGDTNKTLIELQWDGDNLQVRTSATNHISIGVKAEAYGGNWVSFSDWMGGN